MRLIDANLLKEKMEEGKIVIDEDILNCNSIHEQLVYLLEKVEKFVTETIDDMPTAYSVERVVAELKEEVHITEIHSEHYLDNYYKGVSDGYREAIKIVRNGGEE